MIGRTNAFSGGGGGMSPTDAVIHVTAPVGSTISFSFGGVTIETLGADKSHISAADNSLAEWYYSTSDYGVWTIVSVLGDASVTESVTVSAINQYDVVIEYYDYFFKSGVGKIVAFSQDNQTYGSVTYSSTSIVVNYTQNQTNVVRFNTTSTVDLSKYSAIVFDAIVTSNNPSGDPKYNFGFYISSTLNTASVTGTRPNTYLVRQEPTASQTRQLYTLDVSNLLTTYAYVGGWGNAKATIYNIYGIKG